MSRRVRFLIVGAVAVGLLAVTAGIASAGGGWKTFASGSATGRGLEYGSPEIKLSSVTLANPDSVRFTVKNFAGSSRKVLIEWNLGCEDPSGYGVTYKTGEYTASIGAKKTHTKNITFAKSAKYCTLDTWINYDYAHWNKTGKLQVTQQAQY